MNWNFTTHNLHKLSLGLFLLGFVSCADKPSEQMGHDKLNKSIRDKNKSLYEYKNFKKINGSDGETEGTKIYRMDYTADKVALQDLKGTRNLIGKSNSGPLQKPSKTV